MKLFAAAALLALCASVAMAATAPLKPPPATAQTSVPTPPPDPSASPAGGETLLLRGLDKITGRPTNIIAPVGKEVKFATLTITVRFCYSTPASETPETAAFVQIDDHRPDQKQQRVFSGWMYASSPSLNGMAHPLYDVWVISCSSGAPAPNTPVATVSTAPVKVAAPDSSDKEQTTELPAEAGK